MALNIYCLTNLTEDKIVVYKQEFENADDVEGVELNFVPWSESHEGNLKDVYRLWRETGGDARSSHFAFFVDQEAATNLALIVASKDMYSTTSEEAREWASTKLRVYVDSRKDLFDFYEDSPEATRVGEDILEKLEVDLEGRGLSYGRIPASSLYSVYANLDLGNMLLCELVELEGRADVAGEGKMEIILNENWDGEAFVAKLEPLQRRVIEEARAQEKKTRAARHTRSKIEGLGQ